MSGAWAPTVLAVHGTLLGVVVGTSAGLSLLAVAHGWHLTVQPAVRVAIVVAVAVLVVLTVSLAGRRTVGRQAYWLSALAGWIVVPLAWCGVWTWTSRPDVAWVLLVLAVSPVGWVAAVPLLAVGTAVHHGVLRALD